MSRVTKENGTSAQNAASLLATSEIDEIEARRAARKNALEAARAVQYKIDLLALDALEEEHGVSAVKSLHVTSFVEGLPTMVIVKTPGGTGYFKRFSDQVHAAKGNAQAITAAQAMLARSSIVYPTDEDTLKAMIDRFPNMLNLAAKAVVELGGLEAEEEKKG